MVDFLSKATDINPFEDKVPRVDIRKEGDFYIDKVELITYNGKSYFLELLNIELSIHEDIFNHTMSGVMALQDSSDLTQLLPLIGEETLKISFTRPSEKGRGLLDEYFTMEFRVYKVDHRRPQGDKFNIQNYALHFVSPERIKDMKAKVWKTYVDMPYSAMVEKIYNEYLKINKPIEIEPTRFDFKFAASGLSPLQIITILCGRSISDEGNGSSYVFFEDMDKFRFVSIGKLMKEEADIEYISRMSNVLEDQGDIKNRDRTIEEDVRNIENYAFSSSFDVLGRLQGGMYAQQLLAIDDLRQIWEKHDWDHKKEFANMPHLDVADICTDGLDALGSPPAVFRMALTTKDHDKVPHIVAREPGIKPNHIEEYLLIRQAQMQQTLGNKLRVNVSGDPRRRVGKTIKFLMPNHYGAVDEFHKPDPPYDRYLSGKYLVTSLKHRIESSKYYNEFEFMKDTFMQDIEHVDIIRHQDWTW